MDTVFGVLCEILFYLHYNWPGVLSLILLVSLGFGTLYVLHLLGEFLHSNADIHQVSIGDNLSEEKDSILFEPSQSATLPNLKGFLNNFLKLVKSFGNGIRREVRARFTQYVTKVIILVAFVSAIFFSLPYKARDFALGGFPLQCIGSVDYKTIYMNFSFPDSKARNYTSDSSAYDFCDNDVVTMLNEREIVTPMKGADEVFKETNLKIGFSSQCDENGLASRTSNRVSFANVSFDQLFGTSPGSTFAIGSTRQRTVCGTTVETIDDARIRMVSEQPQRLFGTSHGIRMKMLFQTTNASMPNMCNGKDHSSPMDVSGVFMMRYRVPKHYYFSVVMMFLDEQFLDASTVCAAQFQSWSDLTGNKFDGTPYAWTSSTVEDKKSGKPLVQYTAAAYIEGEDAFRVERAPIAETCGWEFKSDKPVPEDTSVAITFRLNDQILPELRNPSTCEQRQKEMGYTAGSEPRWKCRVSPKLSRGAPL